MLKPIVTTNRPGSIHVEFCIEYVDDAKEWVDICSFWDKYGYIYDDAYKKKTFSTFSEAMYEYILMELNPNICDVKMYNSIKDAYGNFLEEYIELDSSFYPRADRYINEEFRKHNDYNDKVIEELETKVRYYQKFVETSKILKDLEWEFFKSENALDVLVKDIKAEKWEENL